VVLVESNSTKGKICHIKGARPNSPRYDAAQSDEERHHFDNLILLCANHHDVIDDDEEAYSVQRMLKMKAVHEAASAVLPEDVVDRGASLIMTNSVVSLNQSGGITAHTLNLHLAAMEVNPDRADATKRIFAAMNAMRREFSTVFAAEAILLAEELDRCFKTRNWIGPTKATVHYRLFDTVRIQMDKAGVNELADLEIHVPPGMWSAFYAHRALIGRLGMLYHFSHEKGAYQDWRTDNLFLGAGRMVADGKLIEKAIAAVFGGADMVVQAAEARFKSFVSL
jgi:hypothetical protein